MLDCADKIQLTAHEEWSLVAPYLILMDQEAAQRQHDLREVFNALRWLVRARAPWRMLPNDLPPWEAVYQQSRRWLDAGCFEAMVSDLRSIIRVAQGERLPDVLGGLHFVVFAMLMLPHATPLIRLVQSS